MESGLSQGPVRVHPHARLCVQEERDRERCIPDVLEMRWVSLERNTFPGMFAERNSSSSVEHVLQPPPPLRRVCIQFIRLFFAPPSVFFNGVLVIKPTTSSVCVCVCVPCASVNTMHM